MTYELYGQAFKFPAYKPKKMASITDPTGLGLLLNATGNAAIIDTEKLIEKQLPQLEI